MKNVYDIRYEKNLIYILPERMADKPRQIYSECYFRTVIIVYLYYIDTLSMYYEYIDGIQEEINIFIISSKREVLERVYKHITLSGRKRVEFILKKNKGRDISALLVAAVDIIKKYEYVCFVHDKKEHTAEMKDETKLWIENMWGNLLRNSVYIDNVLALLEENENLGVVVPPEPIGKHFSTWYGYGWYKSFDITKKIANELKLNADISVDKPPITIGTALWFKSKALWKLFDFGWKYSHFNDSQLDDSNYLSYGIERIFAYVAQDAGYDTGTAMTVTYAEKQTNYLQYTTNIILYAARRFFPISTADEVERYIRNRERLFVFVKKQKYLYLYGAGDMGRFCSYLLRAENILPVGYIISNKEKDYFFEGLPVYSLDEINDIDNIAVVITPYAPEIRREIIKNLENKAIYNYFEFWRE